MNALFAILEKEARDNLRRGAVPEWIDPMLATLTEDHFSDADWIFERKLDGERCLAFVDGGEVRLRSRNRKSLNATYPEVADALAATDRSDLVLDGEVVALDGSTTSFSRLQPRMQIQDESEARNSQVPVYYYVFDLLHLADYDCRAIPLRDRKRLLRRALSFDDPLRFAAHRNEDGTAYLTEACRKGWEGLIAKRDSSEYAGGRSRDWLKFKCVKRQELVIGGFTDPEGERHDFGALVVGFYENGAFVCAGKVGTGFDEDTLRTLGRRMRARERKTSPFDRGETPHGNVHWITPELVAEIGFTEWTDRNRLRHPRFIGLRCDKAAKDVVREKPEPAR